MKITKNYLNKRFEKSILEFKEKIYNFNEKIELEFIGKDKFLSDAKANEFIEMQINMGLFDNFEKEYPNFLVVYSYNKDFGRLIFNLPFKVSLCDELAKEKLKSLTSKEIDEFLRFSFIHEICHIYEDILIKEDKNLWDISLAKCLNNNSMAKEEFVESVIDKCISKKDRILSDKVAEKLWGKLLIKIKKLEK